MNYIKKVILFTCLIGPVMPSQAGHWQTFKNSCQGLYAACMQSLNNGANSVSTNACNAYAYCLKRTCDSAHAVASTVSTSASTFAQNTVTTAGNLRDTTVRVTAPVVNPVVSGVKTGASGIANAAQFTYEHPILVGSGISAAMAAYLAYCKSSVALTPKEGEAISEAEKITAPMFDRDQVPFDKITYWRYYATGDKPAWTTTADIMENQAGVYDALRLDFANGVAQSDISFIDELEKKITESKSKLTPCLTKLKKALAKYYIVPSTRSMRDRQTNNYVSNLVQEYTGADRAFVNLTNEQVESIDSKINSKISRSFINPAKIIRRTILPDEAVVIEQYWNVYQLLQRLEALQACIGNKKMELNGGMQAR